MKHAKRRFGLLAGLVIAVALLGFPFTANTFAADPTPNLPTEKIESFVKERMGAMKIPGMSLTIVNGDTTVYAKGFGYADVKDNVPVTTDTLFEIGSNTKGFTALAVLALRDEGKLNLDDPVQRYLPWFQSVYKGKDVNVTLRQLLHHTSGIELDWYLGEIPEQSTIEDTVRIVSDKELKFEPGSVYRYCTLNYDILGLIIEKVSGQSFDRYIEDEVLSPLALTNTYIDRDKAMRTGQMAQGYKLMFKRNVLYDGPYHAGNKPSAYMIMNGDDAAQWLKMQLGTVPVPESFARRMNETHAADRTVAPSYDLASYAMGWEVFQSGQGYITGQGLNPAYSSYFAFRPGEKWGVALLTNLGSEAVVPIGKGIMDILLGKSPVKSPEPYMYIDNVATLAAGISIPLSILSLVLIFIAVLDIFKRRRQRIAIGLREGLGFALSLIFFGLFTLCIAQINNVFYQGYTWNTLKMYGPGSLYPSAILVFSAGAVFLIYYWLTHLYPKQNDRPYFALLTLSCMSGFGNAMIIFMIMEALNRLNGNNYFFKNGNELVIFFVLGLILYAYGQKVIRSRLIAITNRVIYERRMDTVQKVLNSPHFKRESIEDGKILASLNNDTETISRIANTLVTVLTGMVTVIACFLYLGFVNLPGLLLTFGVLAVAVGLYAWMSTVSSRLWEQARDIQNTFFQFVQDLMFGSKELYLNKRKARDFTQDMDETCRTYRDKRVDAEQKFANVFIIGELLFVFVMGAVTFVFPLLTSNQDVQNYSSFVFVFLYMTGPISIIVSSIPEVLQIRISWNRIRDLLAELTLLETQEKLREADLKPDQAFVLEIEGVTHTFRQSDSLFRLGPIDAAFRSGEITFITGGNGSGKSTLAKLMTGLYAAEEGTIRLNGEPRTYEELGQYFSVIFNDVHLFEKLYGIETNGKEDEIDAYLNLLQLKEKVHIENGRFSTLRLSTGQKKRLALLTSLMEDRPIMLFDEWAAEQDPEYRYYFYHRLLPELKQKGKCVIAITHDDAYFHLADNVIKMDWGKANVSHTHAVPAIS